MSMEAEDMVEEMVPYLGLDQLNRVPFSCGGALDAPQLAARVRRRSFTFYKKKENKCHPAD